MTQAYRKPIPPCHRSDGRHTISAHLCHPCCTSHAVARWLASLGWQVTAVDFSQVEVVRAERVARVVTGGDGHGSEDTVTAWDCLVRLVRA